MQVWMKPPFGAGPPQEVDATPEILTPLMAAGWSQCEPPATPTPKGTEEATNARD